MSTPSRNGLYPRVATGALVLGWLAAATIMAAALYSCNAPVPAARSTSIPIPSPTPTLHPTTAPSPTRIPSATMRPTRPAPTPTPTRSPTPLPDAVVSADSAAVREGPGSAYAIIVICPQGTTLAVLGRSSGGLWLKVRAPDDSVGWARRSDLQVNKAASEIPVADAPPLPTPA